MEHKYKVGDMVRVMVEVSGFTDGNVYEIREVSRGFVVVLDDSGDSWRLMHDQIEPATETPKYDLEAMDFEAHKVDLSGAFYWKETPQGKEFWREAFYEDFTPKHARALAEIITQWADEQEVKQHARLL